MIKNIIFDMGNVILTYDPQEYIKTVTEDEIIAETVLKELFRGREWLELDAGAITEQNALEQVISRIPHYAGYVQKAMEQWHSCLAPVQGMPAIVKRLKDKGYKIYLLSNASLRFFNYKDTFEVFNYFDGFVISAKERIVKPDKAIYDCLCGRFGLKREECLFIDDLPVNIDGAVKAGLKGHLFLGAEELSDYLQSQNIL